LIVRLVIMEAHQQKAVICFDQPTPGVRVVRSHEAKTGRLQNRVTPVVASAYRENVTLIRPVPARPAARQRRLAGQPKVLG